MEVVYSSTDNLKHMNTTSKYPERETKIEERNNGSMSSVGTPTPNKLDAAAKILAKSPSRRAFCRAAGLVVVGGIFTFLAGGKTTEAACTCPSNPSLIGCGRPHCPTICPSGSACISNCCQPCGTSGLPCCAGNICGAGLTCSGGVCS